MDLGRLPILGNMYEGDLNLRQVRNMEWAGKWKDDSES